MNRCGYQQSAFCVGVGEMRRGDISVSGGLVCPKPRRSGICNSSYVYAADEPIKPSSRFLQIKYVHLPFLCPVIYEAFVHKIKLNFGIFRNLKNCRPLSFFTLNYLQKFKNNFTIFMAKRALDFSLFPFFLPLVLIGSNVYLFGFCSNQQPEACDLKAGTELLDIILSKVKFLLFDFH